MAEVHSATPNTQARSTPHTAPSAEEGLISQGCDQLREVVRDHEGQTVLLSLAAGLGVGVLLGCALAGQSRPTSRSRFASRRTAEDIGHRVLESIGRYVPETLQNWKGK